MLHPLPVAALWGVGERTEETLHRYGLRTVGDIAHTPVDTLRRALGPAAGAQLFDLAWGRDPRPVVPTQSERSIGAEETFAHDVDDPVLIRRELLRLSERTAARLRSAAMVGRTVTLKVRFADFTTITRSRTLKESTDVAREVYGVATALYDALGLQRGRVRLVGVRVEGLHAASSSQQRQLAARRQAVRLARRRARGRPRQRPLRRRQRAARGLVDPGHDPAATPLAAPTDSPCRRTSRHPGADLPVPLSRVRGATYPESTRDVRRQRTAVVLRRPECQREVTVPLSEHEQRVLEQMEHAIQAEDPKFATAMRGRTPRARQRRRIMLGSVGVVVGLVLVVLGVARSVVPLAVAGFVAHARGRRAGGYAAPQARGRADPSAPSAPTA